MKIYNKLVISMITGEVLEEDSFEYNGQMILARGEQKKALDKTEYEAQQEKLRADQIRDSQLQQQDQLRGQIMPKYQSMYDNPMAAEERGAAEAATAGPFEAARTAAEHRGAASGNIAGLNEMEDQLARSRSQALSETEANLNAESWRRKAAAVQGMAGLYGVDAGTLAHSMGLPAQYLDIYGRAAGTPRQPNFWDELAMTGLQGAFGIGQALAGKK